MYVTVSTVVLPFFSIVFREYLVLCVSRFLKGHTCYVYDEVGVKEGVYCPLEGYQAESPVRVSMKGCVGVSIRSSHLSHLLVFSVSRWSRRYWGLVA